MIRIHNPLAYSGREQLWLQVSLGAVRSQEEAQPHTKSCPSRTQEHFD